MNPYVKVRNQANRSKGERKQTEIAINFKQPFKLSKPSIEQPKIKMNHAPSVVHIIERKANKPESPKIQANPSKVHIIQPTHAQKGWKFNLNDSREEHSSNQNLKSEQSFHENEKKIVQDEKQHEIINLSQSEENFKDQKAKATLQRRLQRIASSHQDLQNNSEAILEQSKVSQLKLAQDFSHFDPIDIQSVVEVFRAAEVQPMRRNFMYNQERVQNGKSRLLSSVKIHDEQFIDISQLNEESYLSEKLKLRRNLQAPKQNNLFQDHSQIIEEQHIQSRQKVGKKLIIIQDKEGSIEQIIIPDQFQERRFAKNRENQRRQFKLINSEEEKISIMQEEENFLLRNSSQSHRRVMSHKQANIEQKQLKISNRAEQFINFDRIELWPSEQKLQNGKRSSKLMRNLLIPEDEFQERSRENVSESLQRQLGNNKNEISIKQDEEFFLFRSTSQKHKRLMTHYQASNNEEKQIKIHSRPQQIFTFERIELQSSEQGLQNLKKSSRLQRKLLLLEKDNQEFQQIIIPEDLEQSKSRKSNINHRRAINSHKASSAFIEEQPIKEKQVGSRQLPPQMQHIQVEYMQEEVGRSNASLRLSRKLLVFSGKNNQTYSQQIVIPAEFEQSFTERRFDSLKRDLKSIQHQQESNKIIKEFPKSSKVAASIIQQANINVEPINESYHPQNSKVLMARNLLLLKSASGKELYQQILIPQSFEIQQANISNISHKRQIIHTAQENSQIIQEAKEKKLSQKVGRSVPPLPQASILVNQLREEQLLPQSRLSHARNLSKTAPFDHNFSESIVQQYPLPQTLDLQSITEAIPSRGANLRQARNLLFIQEPSGKVSAQEIVIPEEFEEGLQMRPQNGHQRQISIISFQENAPKLSQKQSQELILNPIYEEHESSRGSSRIKRNLLAIKNSNGQTLYQEISIPEESQDSPSLSAVAHRREFWIMRKGFESRQLHVQLIDSLVEALERAPRIDDFIPEPEDIVVSEEFESKSARVAARSRRELRPSIELDEGKEPKLTSLLPIPPVPIPQQQSIIIPEEVSYNKSEVERKLKRELKAINIEEKERSLPKVFDYIAEPPKQVQNIIILEEMGSRLSQGSIAKAKRELKPKMITEFKQEQDRVKSSFAPDAPPKQEKIIISEEVGYQHSLGAPPKSKREVRSLLPKGELQAQPKDFKFAASIPEAPPQQQNIVIAEQFDTKGIERSASKSKRGLKPVIDSNQKDLKIAASSKPIQEPLLHTQEIIVPQQTNSLGGDKIAPLFKRVFRPAAINEANGQSQMKPNESLGLSLHPSAAQKSFGPSTINSSTAQAASMKPPSLGQAKLQESFHFNVYNPRDYLEHKLTSSHSPAALSNVHKPLKPHRRPGFSLDEA